MSASPASRLRRALGLLSVLLLTSMSPGAASAESLRCGASSVSERDSRLSVLQLCGEPMLRDQFCVWKRPLALPYDSAHDKPLVCDLFDQWLYERGEGNLPAVVTFREGMVVSITYGRAR